MKRLIEKNAIIENFGLNQYIGYIPQIKGLIVESNSELNVKKNYLYLYKLKLLMIII